MAPHRAPALYSADLKRSGDLQTQHRACHSAEFVTFFSLMPDLPLEEARSAHTKYASGVAYIESRNRGGDIGIGTCFHVGEGIWVTARHVVDQRSILRIDSPARSMRMPGDPTPTWQGPFFHPDERVDVAAFRVSNLDGAVIPLGGHLDDWFGDEFVLWPVLVMGFPPIPFTTEPYLVAATGEVNAIVEQPHGVPHPHFIISAMPRGGFSGGPVIALAPDSEFTFGLVTESLGGNHLPAELGFFAVLTVEPILTCLNHHDMLPQVERDFWGGLF